MPMLFNIVFVLAQISTLIALGRRSWWLHARCFMIFLGINCVQSISGMIGRPHTLEWWHLIWTPVEFVLVIAAIASTFEIIALRTELLDPSERFSWRFGTPTACTAIVGFFWHVRAATWYGWLVYAREYIWIWILLVCGMTAIFFYHKPVPEFRGLRTHFFTFSALMASHALIAPLNRLGYGRNIPQYIFEAITIICCTSWIMFCCPASQIVGVSGALILPNPHGPSSENEYHR